MVRGSKFIFYGVKSMSPSTKVAISWVDNLVAMISDSEEVADQDSSIAIFLLDFFAISDVVIFPQT